MAERIPIQMLRDWLDEPVEDRVMTLVEDASFTDYFKPLVEAVEAAQEHQHQCMYGPQYGRDDCRLCVALACFDFTEEVRGG